MSCDCCPCWKARNRARIAVNDPETPPANPRNKWGLAGVSSFRSSGNAGPVSYVMARQGGVLLPLTPPRRKERPKVSATGAHDSSSCVLKCSLDKSRPASPALAPSASRGPASQGRRGPKNLRHTTGKHRTRTDAQATPEPASRTCHVLRLLSVLESSKPCPHCRQRPGDTPANPRNK